MIDLLVYSVGYEERSAHVAQRIEARSRIALVFDTHRELSFARNLQAAEARRDKLLNAGEVASVFGHTLEAELEGLDRKGPESFRVAVDVSSMTRTLMAAILCQVFCGVIDRRFALSLIYAPAEYREAPQHAQTFVDFGPIPEFKGWTMYPERPLSVILGLGYEADQAIGSIEYLDPSGIWAY